MPVDGQTIRRTMLEVVDEQHRMASGSSVPASLQQVSLLREVVNRLRGVSAATPAPPTRLTFDEEQAVLTAWYDLFRTGHLSWGFNLNNPDPPHCHVTEQGRRALEHFSRDPANPDGYSAHLRKRASLNAVAHSYIDEALRTYNTECYRATAVMVGAAAESLVLEFRDAVVAGMKNVARTPHKDLLDWRITRVLDALSKEVQSQKRSVPSQLYEQFEANWPAFVQQIRAARNDAGHPARIDPVTPETVHASLLIFPELAALQAQLITWAATFYK
jgi:hypothetical protein